MLLKHHLKWLLIVIVMGLFLTSCLNNEKKLSKIINPESQNTVLRKIRESGKIVALTDYNSTNYFIYRGEPMGYQFELLKLFAEHLEVKLEVVTNNDLNQSFQSLQNGEIDIISIGLAKTKERKEIIDFTVPMAQTRQVLIQRKPKNWRKMKTMDELESHLIRDPLDLAGKTVYIQKNTSFKDRLIHLADEIGDSIFYY